MFTFKSFSGRRLYSKLSLGSLVVFRVDPSSFFSILTFSYMKLSIAASVSGED